jgi:hypothetical protein
LEEVQQNPGMIPKLDSLTKGDEGVEVEGGAHIPLPPLDGII